MKGRFVALAHGVHSHPLIVGAGHRRGKAGIETPLARLWALTWILTHARWKEGQGLKRGQLRLSAQDLADATPGWSKSSALRFLRDAIKLGVVTTEGDLVTVLNFDAWQSHESNRRGIDAAIGAEPARNSVGATDTCESSGGEPARESEANRTGAGIGAAIGAEPARNSDETAGAYETSGGEPARQSARESARNGGGLYRGGEPCREPGTHPRFTSSSTPTSADAPPVGVEEEEGDSSDIRTWTPPPGPVAASMDAEDEMRRRDVEEARSLVVRHGVESDRPWISFSAPPPKAIRAGLVKLGLTARRHTDPLTMTTSTVWSLTEPRLVDRALPHLRALVGDSETPPTQPPVPVAAPTHDPIDDEFARLKAERLAETESRLRAQREADERRTTEARERAARLAQEARVEREHRAELVALAYAAHPEAEFVSEYQAVQAGVTVAKERGLFGLGDHLPDAGNMEAASA